MVAKLKSKSGVDGRIRREGKFGEAVSVQIRLVVDVHLVGGRIGGVIDVILGVLCI